MTNPTTYRDLLNTAAVLATRAGIDQAAFREAADDAYARLIDLGYTPNTGALPPAPIPLATGLGPRTGAVWTCITTYHREHGLVPPIREIQRRLRISSTSVVTYHLKKLEDRGLLIKRSRFKYPAYTLPPHVSRSGRWTGRV